MPVPVMIGVGGRVHNYNDWKLCELNNNDKILTTHWVNITALIYDNVDNKVKAEISTWGKKRYIDMDEFYNNPGYMGGIAIPHLTLSAKISEAFGTDEN